MKLSSLSKMLFSPRKGSPQVRIEVTPVALRLGLSSASQAKVIPWTSIQRAVAFKRDVFAHDLICLALELQPQAVVELDESMGGWNELIKAIPECLSGALSADDWLPRVTFPAFKESSLEIYRRS